VPRPHPPRNPAVRQPLLFARTVLHLVLLLSVALATGCRSNRAPTLSDLSGVEALKTRFNADAGKPRIVLLLSPT
jgi:hypothetical protein